MSVGRSSLGGDISEDLDQGGFVDEHLDLFSMSSQHGT
ncbi:MAG: hypothetical protein OJF50_001669 [Nitrospira sp.]|nr:hypothetical protein [Nitrospira sp.]